MTVPYFCPQDVQFIHKFSGHSITKAVYHNWVNLADSQQDLRFLYALELHFDDQQEVIISSGEAGEEAHIVFNKLDIEAEKKSIQDKFKGQLDIQSSEVKASELWKQIINRPISKVILDQHNTSGNYFADQIIFKIDELLVLLKTGADGDGLEVLEVEMDEEDMQ
ncbi:MAG: hypothetical protein ACFCUU_10085 [Cyclobacteriaceae bacterium]